ARTRQQRTRGPDHDDDRERRTEGRHDAPASVHRGRKGSAWVIHQRKLARQDPNGWVLSPTRGVSAGDTGRTSRSTRGGRPCPPSTTCSAAMTRGRISAPPACPPPCPACTWPW